MVSMYLVLWIMPKGLIVLVVCYIQICNAIPVTLAKIVACGPRFAKIAFLFKFYATIQQGGPLNAEA